MLWPLDEGAAYRSYFAPWTRGRQTKDEGGHLFLSSSGLFFICLLPLGTCDFRLQGCCASGSGGPRPVRGVHGGASGLLVGLWWAASGDSLRMGRSLGWRDRVAWRRVERKQPGACPSSVYPINEPIEIKNAKGLPAAGAVLWWRRPSPGVGTRTSSRRDTEMAF
jgi:hypothetical protein